MAIFWCWLMFDCIRLQMLAGKDRLDTIGIVGRVLGVILGVDNLLQDLRLVTWNAAIEGLAVRPGEYTSFAALLAAPDVFPTHPTGYCGFGH